MNFNSALVYFIGAFLAGLLLINDLDGSIAIAEVTEIMSQIKQHDVIYLGENHDSLANHEAQLKIITQLDHNQANSDQKLAIALEMFQRPFQPILDRYVESKISEAELIKQTEYESRWGFDWEFYAPILRFAQVHQIALIALNTPSEITHKVAALGIDSLEGSDFRYIPSRKDLKLDDPAYRQRLAEVYQQHVESGQGNSHNLENFLAVQVLWDETMAEAIALYYQNHPHAQIAVLVGKAHILDDYAIPDRVAKRISNPDFTQISLQLGQRDPAVLSSRINLRHGFATK